MDSVVCVGSLKPALTSISDSAKYLGVSRAKFYSDILPLLETVRLNGRHLVVVESMDRLIDACKIGSSAGGSSSESNVEMLLTSNSGVGNE